MFDKKVALMCSAEEPFVGFWRVIRAWYELP